MNNFNFQAMMEHGFLIIPKTLLQQQIEDPNRLFWNEFHSITQLPKENIAKAQREWKKLSDKEQQLAIDKVEDYYFHQTNINYLLHAASYLSNKAFLNEY